MLSSPQSWLSWISEVVILKQFFMNMSTNLFNLSPIWTFENLTPFYCLGYYNLYAAQITPGYITFFGCPGLLITFFLPCPALINHFNPFIFQCPALFFTPFSSAPPFFMTHIFLLTGGVGSEQFDRRIVQLCKSSFLFLNFFTCGDKEIFLGGN